MKKCKDCSKWMKGFKPWNEKKVPNVCITSIAYCRKCGTSYEIFKNMVKALPPKAIEKMAWNLKKNKRKTGGKLNETNRNR